MSSPSPRFLATWPPKRTTAVEAVCWYCAMRSRHSSASSCCDSGVEPTRSQNSTVSWRRSPTSVGLGAAGARSGGAVGVGASGGAARSLREAPHSPQNFLFAGFSARQCGHRFSSAPPHSPQNFLPAGLSLPQWRQVMLPSFPQFRQQRLRLDEVARVEAFGEPGVERGEEGAGRIALGVALPESRQAGGGAQLERLGLLPPGDLQGLAEERLRLLDRIPVRVEENLGSQPVELGIVVVLALALGARDAESERAQGLVVAPDLPEAIG